MQCGDKAILSNHVHRSIFASETDRTAGRRVNAPVLGRKAARDEHAMYLHSPFNLMIEQDGTEIEHCGRCPMGTATTCHGDRAFSLVIDHY